MRAGLLEFGALNTLRECIESWPDETEVLEAAGAAMLNLVVDAAGEDMGLKGEVSKKFGIIIDVCINLVKAPKWKEGATFITLVLRIMSSLSLDPVAAIQLYKQNIAERSMEWMNIYKDNADVLNAACQFLSNFSASTKLRIRQALIASGGIPTIADILKNRQKEPKVCGSALLALHNLCSGGVSKEVSDDAGLVLAVMGVLEQEHGSSDHRMPSKIKEDVIHAPGLGVLRNLAMAEEVACECVLHGAATIAMESLHLHSKKPTTVMQATGLLRNLLACANGKECSDGMLRMTFKPKATAGESSGLEIPASRLILATLWKHQASVIVVAQMMAMLSNMSALGLQYIDPVADDLITHGECQSFRRVIQMYPANKMVQYQGLSAVNRMVTLKREMQPLFGGLGGHVQQMMIKYKGTPIADVCDLLLEQVA